MQSEAGIDNPGIQDPELTKDVEGLYREHRKWSAAMFGDWATLLASQTRGQHQFDQLTTTSTRPNIALRSACSIEECRPITSAAQWLLAGLMKVGYLQSGPCRGADASYRPIYAS